MARRITSIVCLFAILTIAAAALAASGDSLMEKAALAYKAGQYEQAVEDLQKAIVAGFDQYDEKTAYAILGNAYSELGRLSEAEAAHKKALEIDPEFHVAWVNLGVVYRLAGDYDKAEECYQKALELKPDYAELHASLGALYVFRQEPEKAIVSLEKSVRLDPRLATAHANLALAYAMAGRFEDADKSLKQAVVLGYKNTELLKQRIKELKTLEE